MVICLERGADLHTAQLMPLPLTVFCFRKIQIGFTFLVPTRLGSPGKRAVERVCVRWGIDTDAVWVGWLAGRLGGDWSSAGSVVERLATTVTEYAVNASERRRIVLITRRDGVVAARRHLIRDAAAN